jgi:hypothetical protein
LDNTTVGTVLGVEEKHLVRQSDNQPFTLYEFNTHPLGRMTSTKRELADQVRELLETPLLLSYSEKANGPYTNRYLNKIELAAQQPLLATPPSGSDTPAQATFQNVPIGRDEAIWRQTATKTATSFHNKDLAEYWSRVEMLMEFYRTGQYPTVGPEPAPEQPGPGNSFLPPQPGDAQPQTIISDDDIPF